MNDAMLSTPVYAQLKEIPVHAPRYVCVVQGQAETFLSDFVQHTAVDPLVLHAEAMQFDPTWSLCADQLGSQLQHGSAGVHVVLYGNESFIWQMYQVLAKEGCLAEEYSFVLAERHLEAYKTVYCVHCGHLQTSTEAQFCHCEQCQVHLYIRRHFSTRLGAYMGVCADAQQPHGVVG